MRDRRGTYKPEGAFPASFLCWYRHGWPMAPIASPGHRALRKGRVSVPGQIYLLTTVTANRTPWFIDPEVARLACRQMIEPLTWGDARPLGWVFMPDHWHGLVELGARNDLSLVMNRFKARISKQVCRHLPGKRLWCRGFHDRAVRRDEDIRAVARYVVANPLRARLVEQLGDYPYWDCVWL